MLAGTTAAPTTASGRAACASPRAAWFCCCACRPHPSSKLSWQGADQPWPGSSTHAKGRTISFLPPLPATLSPPTHPSGWPPPNPPIPPCSIEPADSSFNLVDPSKYNTSFGGLARVAAYVAAARVEAAAAGQDILVLHAGGRDGWLQAGATTHLKMRRAPGQGDVPSTAPTPPPARLLL